MKYLFLAAIQMYQKHISPRKGFGCPLRLQGRSSMGCSGFGKKVIERFGIIKGLALIRRRLDQCAFAAKNPQVSMSFNHIQGSKKIGSYSRTLKDQQGFVDCDLPDVPSCDIPSCKSGAGVQSGHHGGYFGKIWACWDCASCADGCNWSSSSASDREERRRRKRAKKASQTGMKMPRK